MPTFRLTDLEGKTVTDGDLQGGVVLVEFWATWCPPCRGTLQWLGALKQRHGDAIEVLAVAVESDEADVRKLAAELSLPVRWAMGTPDVARVFGDVTSVPTMILFDGQGGVVQAFYGAPP